MNRLLGANALVRNSSKLEELETWVYEVGSSISYGLSQEDQMTIQITDEGSVSGSATKGQIELHLLGWVNSLNGEGFNPLDEPDTTASLLLERFYKKDLAFLNGVEGSYIVVIRDYINSRLVLARDTTGGQSLFINEQGKTLVFASHLGDFKYLLGDKVLLDRTTEEFHLAYEFLPDHKTIYQEVNVLGAGKILNCTEESTEYFEISHPQRAKFNAADFESKHVIDTLEKVMLSSIEQQIPSKGKVAVLLGGFDSALIASMLKKMGREIETFTFQYEDESYNQRNAEELANYLGIVHNWVPITKKDIGSGLRHYSENFNQPVSQAHYPINSLTTCLAMRKKGITHCLTGDGCDGIFLGYPTVHQRAKLIQVLSNVSWLLAPLRYLARSSFLEHKVGHPYRLVRNVLRMLQRDFPANAYISACSIDEFSFSLLNTNSRQPQSIKSEETLVRLAENGRGHSVVRLAYMGKAHVGLNRTKLEGCSTCSGVVLNSPYLHPSMKLFAQLLPDELSRPAHKDPTNATGKYALMHMADVKAYLPNKFIYQRKMSPVTTPVDAWYSGELKKEMKALLDNLPFTVSSKYVNSLLQDKWTEKAFRKNIGISRYTSNMLSMLVTYASFTNGVASSDT